MKTGAKVSLKLIAPPSASGGNPAEITGVIVSTTKAHAAVQLASITKGTFLGVKQDGKHILLRSNEQLPDGAILLNEGDVSTFAFSDLVMPQERSNRLTREEAMELLGKWADCLDRENYYTMPDANGTYGRFEIERIKTICDTTDKEQFRFGDDAQQFNVMLKKYADRVLPNANVLR